MKQITYILFDPQTACLTEQAMFDYIDGKLVAADCHAVEKHLLDCAFCSDAMEGLELVKDRSILHQTQFLPASSQPETDSGTGRIIPFRFNAKFMTAAAAVAILLIGSYSLLRYAINSTQKEVITAQHEQAKPPPGLSPPIVTTPDDQAFSKNFEPFPAEQHERKIKAEQTNRERSAEQQTTPSAEVTVNQITINGNGAEGPPPASSAVSDQSWSSSYKKEELKTTASPKPPAVNEKPDDGFFKSGESVSEEKTEPTRVESKKGKDKAAKKRSLSSAGSGGLAGNDYKSQTTVSASAGKAKEKEKEKEKEKGKEEGKEKDEQNKADSKSGVTQSGKNYEDNDLAFDRPETKQSSINDSTRSVPASSAVMQDAIRKDVTKTKTPVPAQRTATGERAKMSQHASAPTLSNTITSNSSVLFADDVRAEKKTNTAESSAMEAYNKKNYAVAIERFRAILRTRPDDSKALFYMGVSCLSLPTPDVTQAISNFDKVTELGNSSYLDAAAWYKALALVKGGKKEEAEVLLDKINRSNSSYKSKARQVMIDLNMPAKK